MVIGMYNIIAFGDDYDDHDNDVDVDDDDEDQVPEDDDDDDDEVPEDTCRSSNKSSCSAANKSLPMCYCVKNNNNNIENNNNNNNLEHGAIEKLELRSKKGN